MLPIVGIVVGFGCRKLLVSKYYEGGEFQGFQAVNGQFVLDFQELQDFWN